jgi:hypothetical protein
MAMIRDSGQSCNSKWFNRVRKGLGRNTGMIRFVDKSNSKTKKVALFIRNVAQGFSEEVTAWQEFYINPNKIFYSSFFGPIEITSILGSTILPKFIATVGKKYIANNGDIPMSGNASSGSEIQIGNGHSTDPLVVIVKRGGHVIETITILPGDEKEFQYQSTMYIGTKDDNSPITISDANTQINFLGIVSCDIEINESSGVYSFSLANIS